MILSSSVSEQNVPTPKKPQQSAAPVTSPQKQRDTLVLDPAETPPRAEYKYARKIVSRWLYSNVHEDQPATNKEYSEARCQVWTEKCANLNQMSLRLVHGPNGGVTRWHYGSPNVTGAITHGNDIHPKFFRSSLPINSRFMSGMFGPGHKKAVWPRTKRHPFEMVNSPMGSETKRFLRSPSKSNSTSSPKDYNDHQPMEWDFEHKYEGNEDSIGRPGRSFHEWTFYRPPNLPRWCKTVYNFNPKEYEESDIEEPAEGMDGHHGRKMMAKQSRNRSESL